MHRLYILSLSFATCLWAIEVCAQVNVDGLIAQYNFTGDTAVAQSWPDQALNGTIFGSPTLIPDRFGNPESALLLGPGDYIEVDESGQINPLPFSVSVWFKPDLEQNAYSIVPLFKKYFPAAWNGIMFYYRTINSSNYLSGWYIRSNLNRVISDYGSPPFGYQDEEHSLDVWRHAVFTVDSTEGRIYFDGVLQDSQPWDGVPEAPTSWLKWQFGGIYNWSDTLGYQGALDDITVWSRALSADDVADIYAVGGFELSGCTDPAACNYDFNALVDNGLCSYPIVGEDCYYGASICSEGTWWHPIEQQCYPFPCVSCLGDFNGDQIISVIDLLSMLGVFGETCSFMGCTNPSACNYMEQAAEDDGSCIFGSLDACGCLIDCSGDVVGDFDGDGICDDSPSVGCSDSLACNFNLEACLIDNTTCAFGLFEPFAPCDDGDSNTFNDMYDVNGCVCAGTTAVSPDWDGPCFGQTQLSYFGHDYLLLELGDRCWFRENLGTGHFANGDAIPVGLTNEEWVSTTSAAMAHTEASDALTGYTHEYKYNYYAVVDERGLCPTGWYVPSNDEWLEMVDLFGGVDSAGLHLKATPSDVPSNNGDNLSGFTGQGSGWRHGSNGFFNWGGGSHYYTSTLDSTQNNNRALWKTLEHTGTEVTTASEWKTFGLSVRCIKSEDGLCFDPDGDGICPEEEWSGCHDPDACNFNPVATVNVDFTCEYGTEESPCEACNLVWSGEYSLPGGQFQTDTLVAEGVANQLTISVDFSGSGSNWPGDMLIGVCAPNGACGEIGGFNLSLGYDIISDLPSSWNTNVPGLYVQVIDLPEGFSGEGDWIFTVMNGWSSTSVANYDLTLVLEGPCSMD